MNADRALIGIRGHLIDTPRWGELRSRRDGALVIDAGRIAEVGDYETLKRKPRKQEVRWLHSSQAAVFPGLIDTHTHLPQYPVVAKGNMQLLPWLREYIFPIERDFNAARATKEAPRFFHELARHGTTTAMVYSSSSEESTEIAFQAAEKSGLRVIMGVMMMDAGPFGDVLPLKEAAAALAESERLCKKWNGAGNGRIHYAFSPRFALCCSEELMRGAGNLSKQHGAYLQTHLAENLEEIETVRRLFPQAKDYTDVYHQFGLLSPFTVLGHCIHLSKEEIAVLAQTGAAVAHCPTANFFLGSGIMPLDRILGPGIKIGLGSDVAAGPELDMWCVMRSAVEAQKARSFFVEGVNVPLPAEALYFATRGAAEALRLDDIIGTLDVGKEADLTVVDCGALLPYRQTSKGLADLSAEDIASLCVYAEARTRQRKLS